MSAVGWFLVGVASLSALALLFFLPARRHWPIVLAIGLVAVFGLLLILMGVDLRQCLTSGRNCLS